jgi:hypothetical protein
LREYIEILSLKHPFIITDYNYVPAWNLNNIPRDDKNNILNWSFDNLPEITDVDWTKK